MELEARQDEQATISRFLFDIHFQGLDEKIRLFKNSLKNIYMA